MKKILVFAGAVLLAGALNAQVVNMTNASWNKETKPAFTMQMDYSKKIVDEAVEKHFKADKIKGKSENGMTKYEEITYSAMCVEDCDVYTSIDGNGKSATLNIFVVRKNGNFVTSGDDEEKCIKKFMIYLFADVEALDLQYKIDEQTKVYEKSVKEYEKLVDKKAGLEKELKNVEQGISDAEKNREQQKKLLEQLKAQQK